MATHKSAYKRMRQNEKARIRNRSYKTQLKNAVKKLRNIDNREVAEKEYQNVSSLLDKLAYKGIIHKNKAANQKSKLARAVSRLS